MKKIIQLIFIFLPFISISQSGYLGSIYSIDFNISASPTPFVKKSYMTSPTTYKTTSLVLNLSYDLSFNRVLNDKWLVGIGYKYSPIDLFANRLIVEIQSTDNPNIVQEKSYSITKLINITHQAVVLKFRRFSNGISPIGKGFGFNFEFGSAKGNKIEIESTNSKKTNIKDGFFTDKFYLSDIQGIPHEDRITTLNKGYKVSTFILRGYYGRTIPISKKIGLDLSMTFPIIRYFKYNNLKLFGLSVDPKSSLSESSYANPNQLLAYSIKKYNGLSFKIGVKYFL